MSAVTTEIWGAAYSTADLRDALGDGRRLELVEGSLIVTPAPIPDHQDVLGALYVVVLGARTEGYRVLFAPVDVHLAEDTVLQPDLVVARAGDFTATGLQNAPTLAVEVLSPSTRHVDLGLKRLLFETHGVPSYWVVDPGVPSITAWELAEGRYVEAGHAEGDEALVLTRPFPVRIVPQELVP
jgi:Uma2 family endonuclease